MNGKCTRRSRRGQGMTEYIVLLGLIAILLIPAVVAFRDALRAAFEKSSAEIQEEVTSKIK